VIRTRLTRAIQKRHGHKPVPATCPGCGLTRPALESFPGGVFGVTALLWATSGRRPFFSTGIECPRCGRPMTWDEETARRRRRR
jgi:hypothetical protein